MLFEPPDLDLRELDVLDQVEELKTSLRHQLAEPRRWLGSLRRVSLARAIQGSNSIEGYDAGLDDAMDIAAGEEPLDAGEETRLALRGYREAMTYVLQVAEDDDFSFSDQLFKSLHYMMTSYTLKNRPGRWRAGPIFVRNDATGDIVHEGADIDQVPALMRELATALNEERACPDVVRGAMAHLNLVMVHPFRDGNGRMARCLQSLVLARSGVLSPVFMSIEEYLGRNTQAYYDVLATVGGGSWRPERDARPWIRFTMTAHLRQARTMLRRIRESSRMWSELELLVERRRLPERSIMALFDAMVGLRVRNATYRAYFQDTSEEITDATASRDLRTLVAADLLEPTGEKRGRHYVARPELREIYENVVRSRVPEDDPDPFAN
ncbi:Fic family protein [Amycolatopsis alkalitolerans]|uniref:Fic family protein n=1 Tax=Amycolatopsis alkalitolerans TaxID=2547244 RepID=A0A5C4LX51_9PSEU|nr:Fic family protein [Amycolatopsis alkalitolerans]TNC22472.1 Fic family protein [Amycolatopsis alkalitolerans]